MSSLSRGQVPCSGAGGCIQFAHWHRKGSLAHLTRRQPVATWHWTPKIRHRYASPRARQWPRRPAAPQRLSVRHSYELGHPVQLASHSSSAGVSRSRPRRPRSTSALSRAARKESPSGEQQVGQPLCRGFVQQIQPGRSRELAVGALRALARLHPDRILFL